METPKCPVHAKDMRAGKFGYFCPTKTEDGSWCDFVAGNDGNVYQKGGKSSKSSSGASGAPTRASSRQNVDWERLGKIKALCGMANARLSAGKSPSDVISELASLESLLAAIETRAGTGTPGTPSIQIDDSDLPF